MPGRPPLDNSVIGVLVVEDEPLVLMETGDTFRDAGMAVFEARDADSALAILAQRDDIRVVVTDLAMPSGTMDGRAFVRIVTHRWPKLGVMVLSAAERPKPGNMPEGVRFLSKPCFGPHLVSAAFGFVSRQTGSI